MEDWKAKLSALTGVEIKEETKESTTVTKNKRVGVVYSTNTDFTYEEEKVEECSCIPCSQQKLRLAMERAGRGGKTVTVVRGFIGTTDDINALCKLLKQKCGVGGSVKDGEPKVDGRRESQIIIQGDLRTKLTDILKKEGYTNTK